MTYFLKLAEYSGILPLLQRQATYTLFVPTDDAFEALPNDTLSDLFNQPAFARTVVSFHVTAGRHLTSNVIDGQMIGTIQGQEQTLRLRIHKKRLTVESALVVESDFLTRNGVIQILDKVNFPPTASILDHLREGNFRQVSLIIFDVHLCSNEKYKCDQGRL
ncbi:periostin [Trichonephila inaurata madagascariensis]|uniref:Periostin n=1 Tax=Trichonephila inaurata madagascariensis TaxID=2747483 RepID=A0A8X7CI56_9ARAC|nr:periostin [Trichonephila inaurata madagascariensis]